MQYINQRTEKDNIFSKLGIYSWLDQYFSGRRNERLVTVKELSLRLGLNPSTLYEVYHRELRISKRLQTRFSRVITKIGIPPKQVISEKKNKYENKKTTEELTELRESVCEKIRELPWGYSSLHLRINPQTVRKIKKGLVPNFREKTLIRLSECLQKNRV